MQRCAASNPADTLYFEAVAADILRRTGDLEAAAARYETLLGQLPAGDLRNQVEEQAAQVRQLIGRTPIFGICLGHQVLGLALGGKTYKLKFGHRGGNHPVLNKRSGRVEITAQNHGFAVDPDSLADSAVEITHLNLNDQTVEGLRHKSAPLFCVQYHPEAAPGPHDSLYLFDEFIDLMKEVKR
jgi:carbamoyl-phosphate synthase small subunit